MKPGLLYLFLFAIGGAPLARAAEAPWGPPPAPRYSFAQLDADADGALDRPEAKYAGALGRNFGYADRDGNGRLSRAEYDQAMAMGAELYGSGEHSLRKQDIFRSLDADGDGALTPAEATPRADLAKNFRAADTDGDGRIDRGEFSEVSLDLLAAGRRP